MWLVAVSLMFGQSVQPKPFPIPPDIKTDSGLVPLSHIEVNADLLAKAIRQRLAFATENGRVSLDDFLFTQLPLGDLGDGTLVKARWGSRYCGATGNCPFWLYILRNGRYEQILGTPSPKGAVPPYDNDVVGWAFSSARIIPGLIIMSNAGGGHQFLIRFSLRDGRFVEDGCDDLTAKNPDAEGNWFDASQVNIAPCGK